MCDGGYYETGAMAGKQVFGSDGMVVGMGCQTFALWVGVFVFLCFQIIR
jgi:hypothetical protein